MGKLLDDCVPLEMAVLVRCSKEKFIGVRDVHLTAILNKKVQCIFGLRWNQHVDKAKDKIKGNECHLNAKINKLLPSSFASTSDEKHGVAKLPLNRIQGLV